MSEQPEVEEKKADPNEDIPVAENQEAGQPVVENGVDDDDNVEEKQSDDGTPENEDDEEEEEDLENMDIKDRIAKNPYEMEFMKPYLEAIPEKIVFDDIPKINDCKGVWKQGMRKLEEIFAEHIANMHLDFEDKFNKYVKVQTQLEENLEFIEQFYEDMQTQLNGKFDKIQAERDAWEVEKEAIRKRHPIDGEIISLNIGGKLHVKTELDVLTSVEGSHLKQLFSEMHPLKKIDDEVFIDRDGKTFELLINYLRNDRDVFPEFVDKNTQNMFMKELHYWGIENDTNSKDWLEQYLEKCNNSIKRNSVIKEQPPKVNQTLPQNQDIGYGVPKLEQSLYTDFDLRYLDDPKAKRSLSPQHEVAANKHQRASTTIAPTIQMPNKNSVEEMLKEYNLKNNMPMNQDDISRIITVQDCRDVLGEPNNPMASYQKVPINDETLVAGTALQAVKDKWEELGPLNLEDIIANSSIDVDNSLPFDKSKYDEFIVGQIDKNGRVCGVGKEINHIIYEGQFKNDVYHGYGRFIYSNGNYYIGNWVDGKRSGQGKLVDIGGKSYEGLWKHSKFQDASPSDLSHLQNGL